MEKSHEKPTKNRVRDDGKPWTLGHGETLANMATRVQSKKGLEGSGKLQYGIPRPYGHEKQIEKCSLRLTEGIS
jgi:hypothetical protein